MNSFLKKIEPFILHLLIVLSFAGVAETLLVKGFLLDVVPSFDYVIRLAYLMMLILYGTWFLINVMQGVAAIRRILPDLVLVVLVIGMFFPLKVIGSLISLRFAAQYFGVIFQRTRLAVLVDQVRKDPARLLLVSFLIVIVVGMILLMLPAATADRNGASFVDALFTATSATCVTGLIVQDTGTYFTPFGHMVILLLIQAGGLGIMTLSTLFVMMLGYRLGVRDEEQMRGILDQTSTQDMYGLVVRVIQVTAVFEFIGALLLYVKWMPVMGIKPAVKHAVFHSISAFCNAGFSLRSDSLVAHAGDIYLNTVIMTLIVSGGLGFVVYDDVMRQLRKRRSLSVLWTQLSVHTRLVLLSTLGLIISGMLAVFFFEFDNTLLDLPTHDKFLAALFQSVSARTAGFNTIDIGAMRDVTQFLTMVLMFIGASPASTGGGIKTTTIVVLFLAVRSILRSRKNVEIFKRTIPRQIVFKSIAILLFSSSFLIIFSVFLLSRELAPMSDVLFEAVSALGTVGLSTGVTTNLDTVGKLIITLLMYAGRVGPLTMALALGDVKKTFVEYPTTRVMVG